jgi:hypothetical protein
VTRLSKRDLTEARWLAKKAGGWDELRCLAEQEQGRSRGRALAEYDANILAAYDAALKEKDFLPKEVLERSDHARMQWFLKTVLVRKAADHPDLEYALRSGRLGKSSMDNIVRRLMRKRRKDNR